MTVQTSQLGNGLKIVTHRMPGLETASVGIFVNAGARAETESEHGVAHFLEHMAFKGTPTRTPMQIAEEIESAGGALNAVTSSKSTNYYARVLGGDVELGLRLIGDLLLNPAFAEEEMDREREVILQEIAATQDSPDDVVFDLAMAEAFPNQPLGRSILGTERAVSRHSPPGLKRFRSENYSASRIVLSAAGAVDHDLLHKIAEELFAGMPVEAARAIKRAKFRAGMAFRRAASSNAILSTLSRAIRMGTSSRFAGGFSLASPAAAWPRGCSRRCARSAGFATISMPSTGATPTLALSAFMLRRARSNCAR